MKLVLTVFISCAIVIGCVSSPEADSRGASSTEGPSANSSPVAAKGNDLVGKWSGKTGFARFVFEFRADNTCTMTATSQKSGAVSEVTASGIAGYVEGENSQPTGVYVHVEKAAEAKGRAIDDPWSLFNTGYAVIFRIDWMEPNKVKLTITGRRSPDGTIVPTQDGTANPSRSIELSKG